MYKRRIVIITSLLAFILLMSGMTYAYIRKVETQSDQNVVSTLSCLGISLTSQNNGVSLTNTFPIPDEEGLASEPYTYTIENTCSVNAYYEATLNAMNGTTLANLGKVKVALDGDSYLKPTIENELDSAALYEEQSDVLRTYRIDEGYIEAGESKTEEDGDAALLCGSLVPRYYFLSV